MLETTTKQKSVSTLVREWLNTQYVGFIFNSPAMAKTLGFTDEEQQAGSATLSGLVKLQFLTRKRDSSFPGLRYIYEIQEMPPVKPRTRPTHIVRPEGGTHKPQVFLPRDVLDCGVVLPTMTQPLASRLLEIAIEIERIETELARPHLERATVDELLSELRKRID
jgi:hypothetical protein